MDGFFKNFLDSGMASPSKFNAVAEVLLHLLPVVSLPSRLIPYSLNEAENRAVIGEQWGEALLRFPEHLGFVIAVRWGDFFGN